MELELNIVPADADFMFEESRIAEIEKLVWTFFDKAANGVRVNVYSDRNAVGRAEEIETIECPSCSASLDVWGDDDVDEWWGDFQGELFGAGDVLNKTVAMPCCEAEVKIGELDFGGAIVFVRSVITIDDPSADALDADQLAQLEKLTGCKLIQFTSAGT